MLLLLLLSGLSGLAACGGSGGGGGSAGGGAPAGSLQVGMSEFKFTPSTLQAKSGSVNFLLNNTGTTAHDMVIADASGKQVAKSELVQPGNQATFTVANVAAGTYTIFCDVPGHRAAGMEGTLTVT
ncbi:MAG TPA: cupredoxin domain-containing protein [Candidatus Dormibacteraeota bacterium]|nr:cupredoxin domain-containing protein [Candidatus Dormibacteraeota bacterium]